MAAKKTEKKETLYQKEVKKQRTIEGALKREANQFKKEFASKLLKLVTSGFGLVAALAWNELIKELIATYIEPIFGTGTGVVSLLIYAMAVTLLAVAVTYQLSKIVGKEKEED
jgi:hypothetical protein